MHPPRTPQRLLLPDDRPTRSHPHNRNIRSQIYRGDFRARPPQQRVDAIITDPPYGVTDLAYDTKPLDVDGMWDHFDRAAKPSAIVVIFTCQPFTTAVINARPKGV